jgi:3-oxosteroid 1-dehydrogenase
MRPTWDDSYDVVIVGSGAAGLSGAATACASGLRVLIIEKSSFWGGTTALSGGVLWVPTNPIMKANGQYDSLDDALTYMLTFLKFSII